MNIRIDFIIIFSGGRVNIHGSICLEITNLLLVLYVYTLLTNLIGFVDTTYSDPLGPQMERPKTAAKRRDEQPDDFADEELGDDLLPE